jgi:WD40 repeat protein
MKNKWIIGAVIAAVMGLLLVRLVNAQETGDGIPDNCEQTGGAYYQANVFARYEPQNSRVVLVDWSTGADVRELETGLATSELQVRGWSVDCHYVAGAIINAAGNYDTVVWDAVNGGRVGTVTDARGVPHPITWDTAGVYLIVETRNGAFLLNLPNHSSVQLTSDADDYAHSFSYVEWDYGAGQLRATLTIPPRGANAVYDMASGTLLSLTNADGEAVDPNADAAFIAQADDNGIYLHCTNIAVSTYGGRYREYTTAFHPNDIRMIYQEYNHQVILQDEGTLEVLRVLEANVDLDFFSVRQWSSDCHYAITQTSRTEITVWDMSAEEGEARLGSFENDNGHGPAIVNNWSPSYRYLIMKTRLGAYLWDLFTDTKTRLTTDLSIDYYTGHIQNLRRIEWHEDLGYLRMTRLDYAIVEYSLATGEAIAFYDRNGNRVASESELAQAAQEEATAPFGCSSSSYRSGGPYVRYQDDALTIRDDRNQSQLYVIADHLDRPVYQLMGFSPTCRYYAAALGTWDSMDTVIWDVTEQRQLGVFPDAHEHPHRLWWSPAGAYVVIESRSGGYLWNLETDTRTLLTETSDDDGHNFRSVGWDVARGRVYVVPLEDTSSVYIYDMATAQPVTVLQPLNNTASVDFRVIENNSEIVVSTDTQFGIWNLDNFSNMQFDSSECSSPYSVSYNPDRRFVLIGYSCVWDLQALTGTAPYAPTASYRFMGWQMSWVDTYIVETSVTTATDYQIARRRYTMTTYRYDIRTGELISEASEERGRNRG